MDCNLEELNCKLSSFFTLRDGTRMPILGLGVYRSAEKTKFACDIALKAGYKNIDTAAIYRNEKQVGKALVDSGLKRESIFITTKLWDDSHGYEKAEAALVNSLGELGMNFVDLYLVHSPNNGMLLETWDALVRLQREEKIRSIGVSNWNIQHIEALRENNRPLPTVNQIEIHPLMYNRRKPLLDYCKKHGILIQAYGSLFSGYTEWLTHEIVTSISNKYGKSPGQVLLRWALQKGFQIIPKSVKESRIIENALVFNFHLAEEDMVALDGMEGDLGEYWDPLDGPVDLGETHHYEEDLKSLFQRNWKDEI